MLSNIFKQFYGSVRSEQYLNFFKNTTSFNFFTIPVINEEKLACEMQEFLLEKEKLPFNRQLLMEIIFIPRTCVYAISQKGEFILQKLISVEWAIEQIEKVSYQEIKFFSKDSE